MYKDERGWLYKVNEWRIGNVLGLSRRRKWKRF